MPPKGGETQKRSRCITRRKCGVPSIFAFGKNLDAGRIHSARTDGEKRGPQTACGGLGGGAERGQGRDREAEGWGITGPRATTRVAPTCRGCPAPL